MVRYRLKRNAGKASLVLGGKRTRVRPGEVIEVPYGSIPKAFEGQFELLTPPAELPTPPEELPPPREAQLIVEKARRRGFFNVINPVTGERINTSPLKRADAESLAGAPFEEEAE